MTNRIKKIIVIHITNQRNRHRFRKNYKTASGPSYTMYHYDFIEMGNKMKKSEWFFKLYAFRTYQFAHFSVGSRINKPVWFVRRRRWRQPPPDIQRASVMVRCWEGRNILVYTTSVMVAAAEEGKVSSESGSSLKTSRVITESSTTVPMPTSLS